MAAQEGEAPLNINVGPAQMALIFCLVFLMCLILRLVVDYKIVSHLKEQEVEIQQMIKKRQLKILEIKHWMKVSEEDADREIADGVQVFTALKESVERSQAELIKTVKENQRKTEKQAGGFIRELEREVFELRKRGAEVEQLLHSGAPLHVLQSLMLLNTVPPKKDWTEVNVCPPSYERIVRRTLNQLLAGAELKRVQQYAVDVTLDPDTAHPNLILSYDGKQVYDGGEQATLPDNPERFDCSVNVLAKQSFTSVRFYFEVQVEGKTEWSLGVARESIKRKGYITVSPQRGYWAISLRNENEYYACAGPDVRLSLKSRPEKVGVFVDYEGGLVSFYDVYSATLIYSFTSCSFGEFLYPFLRPSLNYGGKNSAPLIISAVHH